MLESARVTCGMTKCPQIPPHRFGNHQNRKGTNTISFFIQRLRFNTHQCCRVDNYCCKKLHIDAINALFTNWKSWSCL